MELDTGIYAKLLGFISLLNLMISCFINYKLKKNWTPYNDNKLAFRINKITVLIYIGKNFKILNKKNGVYVPPEDDLWKVYVLAEVQEKVRVNS